MSIVLHGFLILFAVAEAVLIGCAVAECLMVHIKCVRDFLDSLNDSE